MAEDQAERRYTRAEAAEVLRQAQRDPGASNRADDFTESELREMARELGVEDTRLDELLENREEEQEVLACRDELVREDKRRFLRHAVVYVVVNALVAFQSLQMGGLGFLWLVVIWGIFLARRYRRAYSPTPEELAPKIDRRLRAKRIKATAKGL